MHTKKLFPIYLVVILLTERCSSDDNEQKILDEAPTVSGVIIRDVANNGKASDIEVSFVMPGTATFIDEIRLIIVKSSAINSLALADAEVLSADRYYSLQPSAEISSIQLEDGRLDSDGEALIEDRPYQAVVLSIGNTETTLANSLSGVSNVLTLTNATTVRTLAILDRVGTGGLQVDANGIVYQGHFGITSDGGGDKVYKITESGETSVFATGFNTASGNDIDSKGVLYQASFQGNAIFSLDEQGNSQVFTSSTKFSGPVGLAFDPQDNLYSTNYNNNIILLTTTNRDVSVFAQSALFDGPNGLDFDEAGNLYVSNWNTGDIIKIPSGGGDPELLVKTPSDRNAHLIIHEDIIYVVGRSNHKIYKVDLEGNISDFVGTGAAGLDNGGPSRATMYFPNDIAFNADGTKMYINHVHPDATGTGTISPTVIREVSIVE